MKYGESAFDILYLLFAIACGIIMLPKTVCYIIILVLMLKSVLLQRKGGSPDGKI